MRNDYFDDLLPGTVTPVTTDDSETVTPDADDIPSINSELCDVSQLSQLSHLKRDNTGNDDGIAEYLDERAAIMEHDAGLPREQAEAAARDALRVFQYRLTDNPDAWLVLIAPGCELGQATQSLRGRFGARLLDVRPRPTGKGEGGC